MAGTMFERGTAVEPRFDGTYVAHIGEEWNCPSCARRARHRDRVRAMAAELGDPEQTLRSVSTVFAAR